MSNTSKSNSLVESGEVNTTSEMVAESLKNQVKSGLELNPQVYNRAETESYNAGSFNYKKLAVGVLIAAGIGTLIYFGYKKFAKN